MAERINGWADWLGLARPARWAAAPRFGRIVGAGLLFVFAAVAVIALAALIRLAGAVVTGGSDAPVRDLGLFLGAVVGAPFLVWRTVSLDRQARTGVETLLNERISSAAAGLSARMQVSEPDRAGGMRDVWVPDVTQRIVAIDTLQGIAEEHPELSPRIVRMLAGFVRANFPKRSDEVRDPPFAPRVPPIELQAAITTIGAILNLAQEANPSKCRLGLQGCDFDGVLFDHGFYRAVDFSNSRFDASGLRESNFQGAMFDGSNLINCNYSKVHFAGSSFRYAKIVADSRSRFRTEVLRSPGVNLSSADLRDVEGLCLDDLYSTFGNSDTRLPDNALPIVFTDESRSRHKFDDQSSQRMIEEAQRNKKIPFWCPYSEGDMTSGNAQDSFYSKSDLDRWPYKRP